MKIILTEMVIQVLQQLAVRGDTEAIERLNYYNSLPFIDKGTYFVFTDNSKDNEQHQEFIGGVQDSPQT